jgi:hypothetical protein
MKVVAVIAKYKENIDWVSSLNCESIVYDKSKDIPNIGREAETYIRYIINNYNNLPDYVLFLQGNPFDHLDGMNIGSLNNLIKKLNDEEIIYLNGHHSEQYNLVTRTRQSFEMLFKSQLPSSFIFTPGAQYIVKKENILCRPKSFYEIIHSVMLKNDNKTLAHTNCLVCPWTIERIWPYIFNKHIEHRDIVYNDLL